jgi:hypothetical protein
VPRGAVFEEALRCGCESLNSPGLSLVGDPRHKRNYGPGTSRPTVPTSLAAVLESVQSAPIGSPAPKHPPVDDPPVDPTAVQRRFAHARARRRARIEHKRELKRARVRFIVLLGILLFVTLFLALSIWAKISSAFGL